MKGSIEKRGRGARAAVLAASVLLFVAAPAKESGQRESVWELGSFETGTVKRTTISAMNRTCPGPQTFEITLEGSAAKLLKITGPTRFEGVGMGETRTTDATVDLTGVAAGQYTDGKVVVRCTSCVAPACTQDRDVLHVQLTVTAPASQPSSGVATTTPPPTPATVTRPPCSAATASCEELRVRAEGAAANATRLRSEAERAAAGQQYDDAVAQGLDDEVANALHHAEVLRRQASDYRELAEASDKSAAQNHARAERWPAGHPYREEWEHWAEFDEAEAARRRAEAERLEAEAQALENAAKGMSDRADGLRDNAADLDAAADAAEAEADALWAEYQACLEALETECARQQAQAGMSTTTGTPTPATTTRPKPAAEPPGPFEPGGVFQSYVKDPMKKDTPTVCSWHEQEVADYNDEIRGIWVGGTRGQPERVHTGATDGVITHGSLELQIDDASSGTGPVIHYHCTEAGSFILYYTYIPYESKRRDTAHRQLGSAHRVGRILIGCQED
jgi:hypothetical protein